MRFVVSLCFFMAPMLLKAQGDSLTFVKVDSISYSMYCNHEWKELREFGNRALDNGYDYPHLRVRLADANIALNRPSAALHHLRRGAKQNSADQYLLQQEVIANLMLVRMEPAQKITSQLPMADTLFQRIKMHSLISRFELEGGTKIPDLQGIGNLNYLRISAETRFSRSFFIRQSYQHFGQQFNSPADMQHRSVITLTTQQQYYLLAAWQLSSTWSLRTSIHTIKYSADSSSGKDLQLYFGLRKYVPYGQLTLSALTSDLDNVRRQQFAINAMIYPLGNAKLYLWTNLTLQADTLNGNVLIPDGGVGFSLLPKIRLEGTFTPVAITDFAENEGEFIYNSVDRTLRKSGVVLYVAVSTHVEVSVAWQYENKEKLPATAGGIINRYNQFGIIGGLTWKI